MLKNAGHRAEQQPTRLRRETGPNGPRTGAPSEERGAKRASAFVVRQWLENFGRTRRSLGEGGNEE